MGIKDGVILSRPLELSKKPREQLHNMALKFVLRLLLFCAFYIIIHSLMPKAAATKRALDLEEYLIGEHRTRRRHNYVEKVGLENDFLDNIDDIRSTYELKSTEPDKVKNIPSFIVDYANMIRNDIILLDNSVETRTRKRGNINVRNQVLPDPPCNCEYNKDIIDLGEDYYPRFIENRNCSKDMCYESYRCQSNVYDLTVLKRRSPLQESQPDLPSDLRHRWIAEKQPVTIGCMCTKNYSIKNGN